MEKDRRDATAQNRKARELWKCRGYGKRGKPKGGFPLFSRAPWKFRQKAARIPHFYRSRGQGGWKSGKPKAGFPLSHRPECIWISRRKTGPRAGFALRPAAGAPRRPKGKREMSFTGGNKC